MPASLLHVGITVRCPHGGVVSTISPDARVLVSGMPVITPTVGTVLSGCSFVLAGVPHPCLRVQWAAAATRVFVNGRPALVQTSEGLCLATDGTLQGPVATVTGSSRTVAT